METNAIRIHDARSNRRLDASPWYRQFWPWFLIVLPAASVVLSFATLYMALESMDPVVPHEGDSTSYAAPNAPAAHNP